MTLRDIQRISRFAQSIEERGQRLRQAQIASARKGRGMKFPTPIDLGNGRLQISIEDIQVQDSGVSSRDVLMPLLMSGRFEELEILCKHVPSWLVTEISSCEYGGRIDRLSAEQMRVIVSTNASCGIVPLT